MQPVDDANPVRAGAFADTAIFAIRISDLFHWKLAEGGYSSFDVAKLLKIVIFAAKHGGNLDSPRTGLAALVAHHTVVHAVALRMPV